MEEGDREEKSEGDVTIDEWSEGGIKLALSMEEGAMIQEIWVAPGSWRGQRNGFSSRTSRKEYSLVHTSF